MSDKPDQNSFLNVTVEDTISLRLDMYLANRFTYRSRSQWQKSIRKGYISINGKKVFQPSCRIRTGDAVALTVMHRPEPAVDLRYDLVFEDEYLCAVSKSGDMPVHPAGPYRENTLSSLLRKDKGYEVYPVHRLDRETSGVILFAKSPSVAAEMSSNWKRVTKEYRVLVRGTFDREVVCSVPMGPAYLEDDLRDTIVRKKRVARRGAPESAETLFVPVLPGKDFSLISAALKTGRQHQIRAHCEYLGYPVVGDKIYGGDESIYLDFIRQGMTLSLLDRAGMRRCALHSFQIVFIHPRSGMEIRLRAPLPEDMQNFIDENL